MAIVTALCTSFKEEALSGVHQPTDVYKMALFTSLATLDASTTVYNSSNETSGPGYSAGGNILSGYAVGRDAGSGVAWITFSDTVWLASSITARGALIYNASKSNKAVAVFNFGSDITGTNGAFLVHMPVADSANALIRFA